MSMSGSLFPAPTRLPGSCPATGLLSADIMPTSGTGVTEGCDAPDCPWTPGTRCPRDRAVLHLRSWAWVNARAREGHWKPKGSPPAGYSGRAYTIMAEPNPLHGEIGDGRCEALTPTGPEVPLMRALVRQRRAGRVEPNTLDQYRTALNTRWAGLDLSYGALTVPGVGYVEHGDTLCCACAALDSLAGRCHRAVAAPWLVRAGWRVFLDGAEALVSG